VADARVQVEWVTVPVVGGAAEILARRGRVLRIEIDFGMRISLVRRARIGVLEIVLADVLFDSFDSGEDRVKLQFELLLLIVLQLLLLLL
jgi:hypothetical protein